ncbi:RagB/SusD family nutrient uptake outer membrane protein [uncultured Muribaculum sp.]|uniref:RagB/SusD family nutrient uptake outer membrane protein n=1 Tax=uncultured Muribaculum sp. TaxID=1918613 RepID=UPI002597A95D|nr:RagB/SusD family nutrient uptake outer membrane protein [uncultured Muribaculum sp.]
MKNYIYILLAALVLPGCSDFLEEYSQDTAYIKGYEDLDELLLGDCYLPKNRLAHLGQNYTDETWAFPYVHLMGDEVQENITTPTTSSQLWSVPEKYYGYYTWQQQVGIDPDGVEIRKEDFDWQNLYYRINIASMVIADIDKQSADKPNDALEKNRIKGEAFFLRGAYYFALVNLYGAPYNPSTAAADLAVPIKVSEFIEDKIYSRNTVAEVYSQVISDLKRAEELLEGTTRKSFYHADQNAARLLLSRVYLYMQDYDNCVSYAEKVLERKADLQNLNAMPTAYFLDTDLNEIIFDMGNGALRYSISDLHKGFGVSDYLYGLYDDDADLRKTYFIKYNETGKYPEYVKGGVDSGTDFERKSLSANYLFRTAELYLNAAEACALSGKDSEARNYLNTLRRNRIEAAGYTDVTLSGDALIDYIREERARELCLEGHRWFDLRRYSINERRPFTKTIRHSYTTWETEYSYEVWTYVAVPKQTKWFELTPGDQALTLPVPREVITFNIGMTNNPRPARNAVETINY